MRSFAFLAAPLLASVALAQDDSEHTTVLTIGFTNSAGEAVTATTTYVYQYSNPATTLLTQTNSDGIITGLPSEAETSQPAVVTSQPAVVTSIPGVATIPAGLPAGTTTITQGNSSFVISVGPSTTVVLTSTTSTSASEDASSTGESGDSTPTDGSNPSSTSGSSDDSPTETPGAASGVVPASFGFVSLVALVAALF
ncbi:hypothetical protein EKO27_g5940 [Xylaria grammica]|uniref:Uncharacterized protein n=1 Tax=Xylaria grammica TaxID=363999 RepID=A0A439D415_9PEZI|nr:hypothetical protein EKO27_g5940 [Xylaria grammica]